jgi:hypothetical protein
MTIAIERDLRNRFSISPPRAAILLRAFAHPKHNHEKRYTDRDVSLNWLIENGYLAFQQYLNEVEQDRNLKKLHEHANEAKFLLPVEWDKALEILKQCEDLQKENEYRSIRLTEKGVDLAKSLLAAGYSEERCKNGVK